MDAAHAGQGQPLGPPYHVAGRAATLTSISPSLTTYRFKDGVRSGEGLLTMAGCYAYKGGWREVRGCGKAEPPPLVRFIHLSTRIGALLPAEPPWGQLPSWQVRGRLSMSTNGHSAG